MDLLTEKYNTCRGLFYLTFPSGQHCVYALLCDDGSLYVGQTSDLAKRFREHRAGRAAQWTRRHKPLRIVQVEPVPSRQEAMRLEYKWKNSSEKKRIKRRIQSENDRLLQAVAELTQALAQAPDHPNAPEVHADLDFFQAACAAISK
jgi:putative endonuclease